jgi:predicted HTH domain antitoxin
MTLTLDISDDLKPEEARELLKIAVELKKSVGVVLLEAARDLAAKRRESRREMKEPTLAS